MSMAVWVWCWVVGVLTVQQQPPNIVFTLMDDLGHYNVGWNNPEMVTPTIDSLARGGVILDRHYAYKYCSPTRSSFISGRLPIHVNTINGGVDAIAVDIRMATVADKLKSAGYATHQVGKWHAGSKTSGNLPINRGFDSHLGYLEGAEDHYTQMTGGHKDFWLDNGPAYNRTGTYGAFQYTQRAVDLIHQHDVSKPFFLYQAWQIAHTPNEVPEQYQNKSIDIELRRVYHGMVTCADEGIRNVTNALRDKGMWNNTLFVFVADNGGRVDCGACGGHSPEPIDDPWPAPDPNDRDGEEKVFGANNYPLRGQKFTDFEGGVRQASFMAGGFLPKHLRGTVHNGYVHVCDWYATFSHLAGVDGTDKPGHGVAPSDGLNVWPMFAQPGVPSPRSEIPLSTDALISGDYKIVLGNQRHAGFWTGPVHPNGTRDNKDPGCPSTGCLFNIQTDPTEHVDLAHSHPDDLQRLQQRLAELVKTVFSSDKENYLGPYGNCTTVEKYANHHKNFVGPICTAKN